MTTTNATTTNATTTNANTTTNAERAARRAMLADDELDRAIARAEQMRAQRDAKKEVRHAE